LAKLAELDREIEAYGRDSRRRHAGIPAEHVPHLSDPRETVAMGAAPPGVDAETGLLLPETDDGKRRRADLRRILPPKQRARLAAKRLVTSKRNYGR